MTRWCAVLLVVAFAGSLPAQDIISLDGGAGPAGGETTVRVFLSNDAVCQGWSAGVCHDPERMSVTDVVDGADAAVVNNGGPPDFNTTNIYPGGFAGGVVISFLGAQSMPVGDFELWVATYELGDEVGPTEVEFCNTLGSPPTATVIVHAGASVVPIQVGDTVQIGIEFRRGDCNDDGAIDIADVIYHEQFLFLMGEVPVCQSACDVNDDGLQDIADPISLLNWLFVDGPEPPAPFAECGMDPTDDPITCLDSSFSGCP